MPDFTVVLVRENYAELKITEAKDIEVAIREAIKEVEESDIYERGYWKIARIHKINKNKFHHNDQGAKNA